MRTKILTPYSSRLRAPLVDWTPQAEEPAWKVERVVQPHQPHLVTETIHAPAHRDQRVILKRAA